MLEKIESFLGESGSGQYRELRRHDCGSVILSLARPIAVSSFYDNASLGRFVIVDDFDAAGGGIVLEGLEPSPKAGGEVHPQISREFEDELFAFLKIHFPHRFPDPGAGI
jgi:bifunctional enzyme CysN/CysC/sulfate adenylyltransferase subunit 1